MRPYRLVSDDREDDGEDATTPVEQNRGPHDVPVLADQLFYCVYVHTRPGLGHNTQNVSATELIPLNFPVKWIQLRPLEASDYRVENQRLLLRSISLVQKSSRKLRRFENTLISSFASLNNESLSVLAKRDTFASKSSISCEKSRQSCALSRRWVATLPSSPRVQGTLTEPTSRAWVSADHFTSIALSVCQTKTGQEPAR